MTLARLPIDGVTVELYAATLGYSKWDAATWGSGVWVARSWQPIACQVIAFRAFVGAERPIGVLTQANGGALSLELYDPARILDPANPSSDYAAFVHPGGYLRLRYLEPQTAGEPLRVWAGQIDSASHDLGESRGSIRGVDAVGMLTQMPVSAVGLPGTLYALAAEVILRTGWAGVFTVEPVPPAGDPAVGLPETTPTGLEDAWALISAASIDALQYAYLGPDGVLRFRPHADPLDRGFTVGLGGVPAVQLTATATKDGIVNSLKVRDTTGAILPTVQSPESIGRFGRQEIDRTVRRIPNAQKWADAVLADRALASLEYLPATIIPETPAQLAAFLALEGVELVRMRFDRPTPIVEVDSRFVGRELAGSADGWVGRLLTYQSDNEWAGGATPIPPDPPTPPSQSITRDFAITKLARVSLTNTGAMYGAGAQADGSPVGAWDGWRNRLLWQAALDWSSVLELVSAELRLYTTDQVHIGFGSGPKVRVQRLVSSWSEGSALTPSSSNAVVWPGPSHTATGEAVKSVTRSEDALVTIPCTALVKAWLPAPAGGSGLVNYGARIIAESETSLTYTTEFRPDEYATSSRRPILRVVVKVPL